MRIKDDTLKGFVFINASNLTDALVNFNGTKLFDTEEEAEKEQTWPEKIYHVEVTIYEV